MGGGGEGKKGRLEKGKTGKEKEGKNIPDHPPPSISHTNPRIPATKLHLPRWRYFSPTTRMGWRVD